VQESSAPFRCSSPDSNGPSVQLDLVIYSVFINPRKHSYVIMLIMIDGNDSLHENAYNAAKTEQDKSHLQGRHFVQTLHGCETRYKPVYSKKA
jgi:hypothetical protein